MKKLLLMVALITFSSSLYSEEVKQAKMPVNFLAKKVKDLKDGEKVSVSPEALVIDEDKNVWVQKYSVVMNGDTGLAVIKEKDGISIEISNLKLKWVDLKLDKQQLELLLPVRSVRIPLK